jgi:flavin reductase (DIM6/NTAB) family NADH-FMN oxidoreductase RutF
MDLDQINGVLRLVDREIWIITAAANGRRGGLTATSVAATSLDPQRPMLLIGITPNHYTAELIAGSETFAAHLLRPDQSAVAWNFADGSGRDRDKLAGVATNSSPQGAPVLVDCLAWFEVRWINRFTAADRLFFWADIIAGQQLSRGPPLRENAFIASLSDNQRLQLAQAKAADLALQDSWRRSGKG